MKTDTDTREQGRPRSASRAAPRPVTPPRPATRPQPPRQHPPGRRPAGLPPGPPRPQQSAPPKTAPKKAAPPKTAPKKAAPPKTAPPRATPRPARAAGGSRMPFALLVLGLLGGGLVCLLIINTTLSTAQFKISKLQQQNAQLSQRKQTVQQEIATDEAPATIHQRAFKLGMREQKHLNFLDVRTGRIYRQPGHIPGIPDFHVPGFTP